MEIKAIIFDVGSVLQIYRYSLRIMKQYTHLSIHNFMARKLRISLEQWFDSIDTPYAQSIEGKISKAKYLSIISRNLNISPKKLERLWSKAYKKYFKPNKKLIKLAFKLKKQGYKIAILSDQHYISKEALITKRDAKKFNAVVVSCDMGMRKPNPRFYKLVLRKLKVKAKEAVFIDNQKWNLPPAKKLGFKTILFKNNKQMIRELKKLGVRII